MGAARSQSMRHRVRRWATLLLAMLPLALVGCAPFGGTPTATPPADLALLPVPTQPASFTPTTCNSQAVGEPYQYPSIAERAWASEQVVIGTVTAQDVRWNPRSGFNSIATYSVLRVEARARGLLFDPLFVATPGGTIGSCTQAVYNVTRLPIGTRVLLFLSSGDRRTPLSAKAIYSLNGDAASVVLAESDEWAAHLLAEVRAGLRQPPPPDLDAGLVVPPDRAPITDP